MYNVALLYLKGRFEALRDFHVFLGLILVRYFGVKIQNSRFESAIKGFIFTLLFLELVLTRIPL